MAEWVSDDASTSCQRCEDQFTFINRRHHCRSCGLLVCGSCSKHRIIVVAEGSNTPTRVCNDCFDDKQTDNVKDNHLITVPMWKSKMCKPDEARGKKRATAYLVRVRLAGGGSRSGGTPREPSVKLVWKYFEDFVAFDASWRKWFPNLPWCLPPRHLSLRKMGAVEKDDRQRALAYYLQGLSGVAAVRDALEKFLGVPNERWCKELIPENDTASLVQKKQRARREGEERAEGAEDSEDEDEDEDEDESEEEEDESEEEEEEQEEQVEVKVVKTPTPQPQAKKQPAMPAKKKGKAKPAMPAKKKGKAPPAMPAKKKKLTKVAKAQPKLDAKEQKGETGTKQESRDGVGEEQDGEGEDDTYPPSDTDEESIEEAEH